MTTIPINDHTEWLEADGLGGFASGTTSGIRTRRYHALLLAATTPPTGRMVLVNGVDAWVEPQTGTHGGSGQEYLTRQRYAAGSRRAGAGRHAGVVHRTSPGPPGPTAWRTAPGSSRRSSSPRGAPFVAMRWRCWTARRAWCSRSAPSSRAATRTPSTTRMPRSASRRRSRASGSAGVRTRACPRSPRSPTGDYRTDPQWYRGFLYDEERARGLDSEEDLARPGSSAGISSRGAAVLLLGVAGALPKAATRPPCRPSWRGASTRRRRATGLAARARRRRVLVRRGDGQDHHRRLSLVHRLGPRHLHRAARALPRDRPADGRAVDPAGVGRRSSPRACCPTASRTRATQPSSTRSTRRSGTSIAVHDYLQRR